MYRILPLLVVLLAACGPGTVSMPAAVPSPELHRELVRNTNYDPEQVVVQVTPAQVTVEVANSNLLQASHQERDADAERIAQVLERSIVSSPALKGVQAIHVDYVAIDDRSWSKRDSMDFRRDREGRFRRDVS